MHTHNHNYIPKLYTDPPKRSSHPLGSCIKKAVAEGHCYPIHFKRGYRPTEAKLPPPHDHDGGGGDDYDDSDHGDDDCGGDEYSNYDYVYRYYKHISIITTGITIIFSVSVDMIMAMTMTMTPSIIITMTMTTT